MDPHPPDQNPCNFGWLKNERLEILVPVGIPKGIDAAPIELLKTIRCSWASEKPCYQKMWMCISQNSMQFSLCL